MSICNTWPYKETCMYQWWRLFIIMLTKAPYLCHSSKPCFYPFSRNTIYWQAGLFISFFSCRNTFRVFFFIKQHFQRIVNFFCINTSPFTFTWVLLMRYKNVNKKCQKNLSLLFFFATSKFMVAIRTLFYIFLRYIQKV